MYAYMAESCGAAVRKHIFCTPLNAERMKFFVSLKSAKNVSVCVCLLVWVEAGVSWEAGLLLAQVERL